MANKHEKVLNFISCKRNAKSNHNAIPLDTHRLAQVKKMENPVCEDVKHREPSRRQVSVSTGTATLQMESQWAVPLKHKLGMPDDTAILLLGMFPKDTSQRVPSSTIQINFKPDTTQWVSVPVEVNTEQVH